jgi:hypothetical protein
MRLRGTARQVPRVRQAIAEKSLDISLTVKNPDNLKLSFWSVDNEVGVGSYPKKEHRRFGEIRAAMPKIGFRTKASKAAKIFASNWPATRSSA